MKTKISVPQSYKISTKTHWIIEGPDDYKSQGYETKSEAQYRLNEMANDSFYNCSLPIIRRSNDMFTLSDGTIFHIVKW